ncbi:MAG: hypothetical protein L0J35_07080, partial [Tetragenococcus halophilus]|nr:hypothetical protein [Tetragenococcus halophilus]
MNCNQANKIPIKSVLRSFFLFPSKNSKRGAFYFAVDRKECTPSLHVDYKRNIAHDFGTGKNYDNVSLVQTINRCSITEALEYLSSFSFHNFSKRIAVERKKENWRIREIKSVQHPALINYIKKRRVFEQSQFLKE